MQHNYIGIIKLDLDEKQPKDVTHFERHVKVAQQFRCCSDIDGEREKRCFVYSSGLTLQMPPPPTPTSSYALKLCASILFSQF